jgi:hypothetical protein
MQVLWSKKHFFNVLFRLMGQLSMDL